MKKNQRDFEDLDMEARKLFGREKSGIRLIYSVFRFDFLAVSDLAFVDSEGETAVRISASPCFEHYRCSILSII